MTRLATPIYGYEWSVPVPFGVDLEDVLAELLKLGAHYVWLDVLCLRALPSLLPRQLKAIHIRGLCFHFIPSSRVFRTGLDDVGRAPPISEMIATLFRSVLAASIRHSIATLGRVKVLPVPSKWYELDTKELWHKSRSEGRARSRSTMGSRLFTLSKSS
ncbi:hypothetical protein SCHPADRAFT_888985 [Schizopora paradoxa]|uniref:Heterokaryon incompatibility domain-containing protein n=1 Tax=Schizopora paradoxa TaxID=27342 RepID=A0A0H2RSI2_9AGAM|nr:hypothetical protein SCHPADRAFT_888985 [Schizopora paradoxa]